MKVSTFEYQLAHLDVDLEGSYQALLDLRERRRILTDLPTRQQGVSLPNPRSIALEWSLATRITSTASANQKDACLL